MIRTRDLVLILVSIFFVVLVTGVQVLNSNYTQTITDEEFVENTGEDRVFKAEVVISEDTRAARLAALRERFRHYEAPASVTRLEDPVPENPDVVNDDLPLPTLKTCPHYQVFTTQLPRLFLYEAEGMRIISTVLTIDEVTDENMVAVLPVRLQKTAVVSTCIASDVVGIALDGSLIRVNEYGLYGVFGAETLVGYALDGFPIYGRTSSELLDSCGGMTSPAGYRYHIAPERESIIQCFSGTPVNL